MSSIPEDLGGYTLTADYRGETPYIVFFHSICGALIPFSENRTDEGRNIDVGEAIAWCAAHRLTCKGVQGGG